MKQKRDLTTAVGKRYGKLVVEKVSKLDSVVYFYCRCDCGNHKLIDSRNILRGLSRSCGCTRSEAAAKRAFSPELVEKILTLRASGLSFGGIAKRLGISRNAAFEYCKHHPDEIQRIINSSNIWK